MRHVARLRPPRLTGMTAAQAVIVLLILLNLIGFGLLLPTLPFYALALGATASQVGLLFALFVGFQFLTAPAFAAASNRFGRRAVILTGLTGQAVGYLLISVAANLSELFLACLIAGTAAGSISAYHSNVLDVTPLAQRPRAHRLLGAAFGGGLLVGPLLGAELSNVNFKAPAIGAAALLGLTLLLAYVLLDESLPATRREHQPIIGPLNPFEVLVPGMRRPAFRLPLIAAFLLNAAFAGFQGTFAVFANQRFGFGPADVARLLALSAFAYIVVQAFLLPRLSRDVSERTLVVAGTTVNAAGFIGLGTTPVVGGLVGAAPILTGGYSLSRTPLAHQLTQMARPNERVQITRELQSVVSLAGILGPIGAGLVYDLLGRSMPYWIGGLAACAVGLAFVPGRAMDALTRGSRGLANQAFTRARAASLVVAETVQRGQSRTLSQAASSSASRQDVDQGKVASMNERAVSGGRNDATTPDLVRRDSGGQPTPEIDRIIQHFGDQYVAHLRSLNAELQRFYEQQHADLNERVRALTQQLARKDEQLTDMAQRLSHAESDCASLRKRLIAAEQRVVQYANDLNALGDDLRRRAESAIHDDLDVNRENAP